MQHTDLLFPTNNECCQFVNAGLRRVTEIFREWDPLLDNRTHNDLKKCASEILRLMANIVAPFRKDASLPQLDLLIQEAFFSMLCAKIKKMTEMMGTLLQDPWEEQAARGTQAIVFLARMLQFHLGFSITWSPQAKEQAEELCYNLTRLALVCTHSPIAAFHMLNTYRCMVLEIASICSYSHLFLIPFATLWTVSRLMWRALLLFSLAMIEIPMDVKATAPFDPFRNYPEFNLCDLPADMPPEYKTRMRSLLPYVELNPTVEGLVYITRDASGAVVSSVPVQNRPWEWTEYIGENPAGELSRGGDERALDDRSHVKNSAALSLDLFEARVTGDHVILPPKQVHQGFLAAIEDTMAEANLRSFQDDVFSEGPFRRDWRDTRISFDDAIGSNPIGRRTSPQDDDNVNTMTPLPALTGHAVATGASEHRLSSRRPSPASSVRSAGSARSVVSHHAFSRLSASTTGGEVIDVDALEAGGSGTGSSNKRKAMSTIAEEDSDIEIIEGPVPTSDNRGQKRAKARAAGKTTKGKRR